MAAASTGSLLRWLTKLKDHFPSIEDCHNNNIMLVAVKKIIALQDFGGKVEAICEHSRWQLGRDRLSR